MQTNPSNRKWILQNALCIRPNREEVQPKRKAKRCTQQPRFASGIAWFLKPRPLSLVRLSLSLYIFINAGRGQVRRNSIQQAHNCLATKVKLPIAKHKAPTMTARIFLRQSSRWERERKNPVAHTAAAPVLFIVIMMPHRSNSSLMPGKSLGICTQWARTIKWNNIP